MLQAQESETPQADLAAVRAGTGLARLYRMSAVDVELRVTVEDGRVGLALREDGTWSRLGPQDILEIAGPRQAPSVVMRIADVLDAAGQTQYRVWGRTESGCCDQVTWVRGPKGLQCKLSLPPSVKQANWIKFTIGATPARPGMVEPEPLDPMAIVKKEG